MSDKTGSPRFTRLAATLVGTALVLAEFVLVLGATGLQVHTSFA